MSIFYCEMTSFYYIRSQQNPCLFLLLLLKIWHFQSSDLFQFELPPPSDEGTNHFCIWCLQILWIVCWNKDFTIWVGECKATIYCLFYPNAQCFCKQMLFTIFSLESMTFLLILSCSSFWILKPGSCCLTDSELQAIQNSTTVKQH